MKWLIMRRPLLVPLSEYKTTMTTTTTTLTTPSPENVLNLKKPIEEKEKKCTIDERFLWSKYIREKI